MTIKEKATYYVDSAGQLQGYHWANLLMRIIVTIQNWFQKGKIDQDAVEKITEAFNFILNISTNKEGIELNIYPDISDANERGKPIPIESNSFLLIIPLIILS